MLESLRPLNHSDHIIQIFGINYCTQHQLNLTYTALATAFSQYSGLTLSKIKNIRHHGGVNQKFVMYYLSYLDIKHGIQRGVNVSWFSSAPAGIGLKDIITETNINYLYICVNCCFYFYCCYYQHYCHKLLFFAPFLEFIKTLFTQKSINALLIYELYSKISYILMVN